MQESNKNMNGDGFNSNQGENNPKNKRLGILVLSLIILGTSLFFSAIMIMRSGGMPRLLFVLLTLTLGYLIYETITKYKSTN